LIFLKEKTCKKAVDAQNVLAFLALVFSLIGGGARGFLGKYKILPSIMNKIFM
jgi:hypothetical protein